MDETQKVQWRDLYNKHPKVIAALRIEAERSIEEPIVHPEAKEPQLVYALQAAEAAGGRRIIKHLFETLLSQDYPKGNSPFIDTTKN